MHAVKELPSAACNPTGIQNNKNRRSNNDATTRERLGEWPGNYLNQPTSLAKGMEDVDDHRRT
ncbi:ThiJ/PfpI domain-containing protein [Anopheles sinensis]|uniref:ThiJ/PfpI domain-containing protein n=1 Tax=Anopheles sinensis TaxID=74873 RepID=A0A084VEA9_ANOSI|nr:ThiJ/PfpI domain-containing protein [Anopheles sinensis]